MYIVPSLCATVDKLDMISLNLSSPDHFLFQHHQEHPTIVEFISHKSSIRFTFGLYSRIQDAFCSPYRAQRGPRSSSYQ
jgi:hypothetical protein